MWFNGPIFLTMPESGWPKFNIGDKFEFEITKEEKNKLVYSKDSMSVYKALLQKV